MEGHEKVKEAADKIRREGHVPDDAAPLIADLLDKHREMTVGPPDEGGWPRGWLAVDQAQIDLADTLLKPDG